MALRLEGKIAVITGAGSGMGAAMAELFCAEGARVIAVDISGAQNGVAARIGESCTPFQADITKTEDVQAMLGLAVEKYGRLDILCNNAAIDGPLGPAAEYSESDFDRVWNVTGRSVFIGMRNAIPLMLRHGGGSIVNTASIASLVAFPTMVAYGAAKGAVLQMTKTFAAEYARQGIRVNALLPGAIRTGMTDQMPAQYVEAAKNATPMGRMGQAAEMAQVALFLASDGASFVTGAGMVADGGYTIV
ncbi:SDR family oxidoreductase [Telluria mixta]|uniref:SDR family oxidoreductase n=1 Tax=Telluria mixta TaxID=34071 RepID=A0ABT2C1I0_9BURK|nr:SDR family NAD(P)-dependent oxidoreductase [Telluria mixta]MCS0631229.1 SDR family oxidoreductase [Telluria mixta]WEM95769.1 SDR family NAD(P)-dependent oxidoreductase [Telluria mixta]